MRELSNSVKREADQRRKRQRKWGAKEREEKRAKKEVRGEREDGDAEGEACELEEEVTCLACSSFSAVVGGNKSISSLEEHSFGGGR